METLLQVPQGNFKLQRLPKRPRELLRAWDAADEYLLTTFNNEIKPALNSNLLIFNDSFGAITVALNKFKSVAVSDSFLSQQATLSNFKTNSLSTEKLSLLNSLDILDEKFDYILIKLPKTLAFLEYFLIRIQSLIHTKTQIIVAGMVKNFPKSVWNLLVTLIGETTTSLAKKKARLIFVKPTLQQKISSQPFPTHYPLENTHYKICNHANVFSREHLDIGTRFLLAHLPHQPQAKNIVDLGCGNGVVGLMLAEKHPEATLHFVDESFMAIDSAKQNFKSAFGNSHYKAQFYTTDALSEFTKESMDLIICNPPFHQQNTVGDYIALNMFHQAHSVLKKSGQLWVIGNRHLDYEKCLKKRFSRTQRIAENNKFVIIQATK